MVTFDTSPSSLKSLIAGGESATVEFKARLPPQDVIAKTLVAFANTDGGVLVVGIADDGTIIGLSPEEAEQATQRIERVASSVIGTGFRVGTVVIDGNHVAYAAVEKASPDLPPKLTADGEAYQRNFSRDVKADLVRSYLRYMSNDWATAGHPRRKEVVVFVAMSFRSEEEPSLVDYFKAIERAGDRSKNLIKLKRMDLLEGDFEISQKIMDEIDRADAVLADLTLSPHSVYFELGYARGRRKLIIQTARSGTSLEFDVRNWKTLFYRNATELEELALQAFNTLVDVVSK
jgi:Putative DNA-binding domain